MWLEFFRFDLRYQLRQPLLWVAAFLFGMMAFGASTSDAIQVGGAIGNVHRNAPTVIAQFLGVFTVLGMFVVTIFIAGSVLRDSEFGMSDLIFATPMKKHDYLIGRFVAGLVACLAIFALVAIGLLIGPHMPWVDAARVGPVSMAPFLFGFAVFVIPNLLFIGALLMLLAATTRSMLMVYVGVMAFFVLWTVAGALTRNVNNEWLSVLLDPFGIRAFGRMIRYYSVADSNNHLPVINSFLLYNRLLWSSIGLGLFGATVLLFKPQRAGTGRSLFGKTKAAVSSAAPCMTGPLRRVVPQIGAGTAWAQCWAVLRFDAAMVFKSVPFLVMLLFGVMNYMTSSWFAGEMYGTKVYPVTRLMLQTLSGTFSFMLVIITTFYAGELVFKERQAKIADVTDAMPVPNWVPLLAKALAMTGVVAGFLLAGVISAMLFQLFKGGVALQPLLYLKGALIEALPFVLLGLIALVLQVLLNNKFIGYGVMIVLIVSQIVMGTLHFDHNLYNIASLPQLQYSDMNGYGHFLSGWAWYALYWSLFAVAGLIIAQAFWVRGVSQERHTRLQLARQRLAGRSGLALGATLAAFTGTGGWIFYNTNVINEYLPGDAQMDRQAAYEKQYRRYKGLPTPRITDVKAKVDIFPAERRVAIEGEYLLVNKLEQPIDSLRLQLNPDRHVKTVLGQLPPHTVTLDDPTQGFRILKLARPLAPGEHLKLAFQVDVRNPGFTNKGSPNTVNLNGTFFNNGEFFPMLGYNASAELQDRNERRKRGLGEPQRAAKLEDASARQNSGFGDSADWINFDTTVSTSSDQIALAPGYLQKEWTENGRRYFHYTMDRPILNFFAYLSADWQVKKGDWKGVPIEIYYDKKHGYNVDRMITATQKSLDYFTSNFTPYQHKQVRILEFPRYAAFAQSFPNTIPFSEDIGFIADLRNKDDVDYVYFVTAHEMAHQWWGHQEAAADMQGGTMLVESLAQYSALMVMEKAYGREHMRKFFKHELDNYLRNRGGELIEELPLYKVENQPYIHYRKGALIFYRLRDEIGEAALNKALRNFLGEFAFKSAPYPTSLDLLRYIRAEAPADKQALITDLFEKIVFYDNRVSEASAKQRADGQWDVTMKLHQAKLEMDGQGKEKARSYDEPVEIAVFARGADGKESSERLLFHDKRRLSGGDPVLTVTVKEKPYEVGIDPYNLMIDRVSADNRKTISIQ
ncbi:ABC transporter permease/M1 family aminopeptidase [Chitinimonas sp.]|uniref:ABC transporter permease/M1 family aminopeptidase n=1 Tax=Chitinimonas sp. TaxID=1934313 RepID=UPI0035B0AE1D